MSFNKGGTGRGLFEFSRSSHTTYKHVAACLITSLVVNIFIWTAFNTTKDKALVHPWMSEIVSMNAFYFQLKSICCSHLMLTLFHWRCIRRQSCLWTLIDCSQIWWAQLSFLLFMPVWIIVFRKVLNIRIATLPQTTWNTHLTCATFMR